MQDDKKKNESIYLLGVIDQWATLINSKALPHSMATANLKKSEDFVTNTTAASKYYLGGPKSA